MQLLQIAKDSYHNCSGKEKSAKYYIANKKVLKHARNRQRNFSEEEMKQKENMEKQIQNYDKYEKSC